MKRGIILSLFLCSLLWGQWQLPPYQKPMLGMQLDWSDPTNTNVAARWLMNEGGGSMVGDSSGNNRTGTIAGATWTSGNSGSCLSFAGTGSITIPEFAIGSSIATFYALLNLTGTDTTQIVWETSTNYNNNDHSVICLYNGTTNVISASIQASVATTKYRGAATTLQRATGWHHLAVVYDNSTASGNVLIYIDGRNTNASISGDNKDLSGNFASLPLYIGARAGTSYYTTMGLSCFGITSRALTPPEIVRICSDPFAGFHTDPYDLWQAGLTDGGSLLPIFSSYYRRLQ